MKNLIKYVQSVNSQNNLWSFGDTIIIGVSGGPDSMCLFDVFVNIAKKENLTLVVAHVNYGLRGEDSMKDQSLVEEIAKKHDLPYEVLVCEDDIAKNENAWRDIRYDFFVKTAQKYKAQRIAVAHTKNDQAETLLLHLLRGSGLRGLSGMSFVSANDVVRPFLGVEREDVLKYCAENEVKYNLDNTNEDTAFTRNKVRQELIPFLKESFNPNIISVLANASSNIGEDYSFLISQQKQIWTKKGDVIVFSANDFLKLHLSMQRMALFAMIEELEQSIVDINSGIVEEFRKAIHSSKNKHQKV
ncbi:MAG: tRNA lysidine(34) synthetase TilS, partial [Patescibacteria group bacterium]